MIKYLPIVAGLLIISGCNTQPMPNINIGGVQATEGCIPGDVVINLIMHNDKAIVGDDAALNDDDAGLSNPTLGL